jgi:hypothetical protein
MASAPPAPTPSAQPAAQAPQASDDNGPSVMQVIKSALPDWVSRIPADMALMGVFLACIVFGLVVAGLRRSRDSYDWRLAQQTHLDHSRK